MPISQVMPGKYPRCFSIRFTGSNTHNSDAMAEYVANKMNLSMGSQFRLNPGKVDKSCSSGQWYLWEYGLQSLSNGVFVGRLRIKQPLGGQQIWFWAELCPLPEFKDMTAFRDENAILNYLRFNP